MENNTILIFGGTGSLGYKLTEKYLPNNKIVNYSRDEEKHWRMRLDFNNNPNLDFVIGDIRDKDRVKVALTRIRPNIVIIAAAMKHIDQCELATHECIGTNLTGVKNILDSIEELMLPEIQAICFVSTDKACSPVNIYGMSKAISEVLMVEKSYYLKNIKLVTVRYGNVLNSRGSIIPILHNIGKNPNNLTFKLTHENMTRFVMTLEQSVELIDYALTKCQSGDIVIPKLVSMYVKDLIELFSEKYNKPYEIVGLRPGEKMLESLINKTQSMRLVNVEDGYHIIKPHYIPIVCNHKPKEYNSKINPLNKEGLREYLLNLQLI